MNTIDAPDFVIGHELRLLALQGDWDLRHQPAPNGGRFVVNDRDRADQCCKALLTLLPAEVPHLLVVPELCIPKETVPTIVQAVRAFPGSLVFVGGVEGVTKSEYEELLQNQGQCQTLVANAVGDYVNPVLTLVRTPTSFHQHVRAKRVASGAENQGPPMSLGGGPFLTVRLGGAPLTLVPLICAEFVWPEVLLQNLDAEVPGNIDLLVVLQRNNDPVARHTSPELHRAYTHGPKTGHARFVFANQALDDSCDGTCYVVVPPGPPSPPPFDLARNELWHLPGAGAHKGFRIPDVTGCIWSATIRTPQAPTNALGAPLCTGQVNTVLVPGGSPIRGLAAGLMRSVASLHHRAHAKHQIATDVHARYRSVLDQACPNDLVIRQLTTDSGNQVFFQMICAEMPRWDNVEAVIADLVEAAALLATGGDSVLLGSHDAGNCNVAGRALLILYAPDVDVALAKRFGKWTVLDATGVPSGVVIVGMTTASLAVSAERIGDVLRADRVTTSSRDLSDIPAKTEESSVTIRIDDIEFHSSQQLRANLKTASMIDARSRLQDLFPRVYA